METERDARENGHGKLGRKIIHSAIPIVLILTPIAAISAIAALKFLPWVITLHPRSGLNAKDVLAAENDARATVVELFAGLAVAAGTIVAYLSFKSNRDEQASEQVNRYFTRAVELLGHERAPVRLGAVQTLAQLGQNNTTYRQTIVDVICAYLRMPPRSAQTSQTSPESASSPTISSASKFNGSEKEQERLVRKTAENLLAAHLRRPMNIDAGKAQQLRASPQMTFWPGVEVDLTGAEVVGGFHRVSVTRATFDHTTFSSSADFYGAAFRDGASFREAAFDADADFRQASFEGEADFASAHFLRNAYFNAPNSHAKHVTFAKTARFDGVQFGNPTSSPQEEAETFDAQFEHAEFSLDASFKGASFNSNARFAGTSFRGEADFRSAAFLRAARFTNTHFISSEKQASFKEAEFFLDFNLEAEFRCPPDLSGARAHPLESKDSNLQKRRWPPAGWILIQLPFKDPGFYHFHEVDREEG